MMASLVLSIALLGQCAGGPCAASVWSSGYYSVTAYPDYYRYVYPTYAVPYPAAAYNPYYYPSGYGVGFGEVPSWSPVPRVGFWPFRHR